MAFDHPLGNKEVTQSAHLEPENISLDLFQPLRCLFAGFLFLFGNGVKRLIGLQISFLETNRRRGWVAVAKRIRSLRVGRSPFFSNSSAPGTKKTRLAVRPAPSATAITVEMTMIRIQRPLLFMEVSWLNG